MGGAIKAIGNVAKAVTNTVQKLSGAALKNVVGNLFNTASGFLKALSPIAPSFFSKIDEKLQSLQPKVNAAIDKGVAFAQRVSGAINDAATNLAAAWAQRQPVVAMARDLGF